MSIFLVFKENTLKAFTQIMAVPYSKYLTIALLSFVSALIFSGIIGTPVNAQNGPSEIERRLEDFGRPPEVELPQTAPAPAPPAPVAPAPAAPAPVAPAPAAPAPVAPAPPEPRPRVAPRPITPPAEPSVTQLQFGFPQPGVLGQADFIAEDGRRIEFFEFEGIQGQPIILTVSGSRTVPAGSNFSPNVYAAVIAPSGEIVDRNDVAGGERREEDERLWLRLPEAGTYLVAVSTDPGREARFSVALQRDTTRYRLDDSSVLTEDSPRLDDGSPFRAYSLVADFDGQFINIQATSPDFDTYLVLVDSDFNILAADNDSGGNFNSLIRGQLPTQGQYYVLVNALRPEGRGRYRLTIY